MIIHKLRWYRGFFSSLDYGFFLLGSDKLFIVPIEFDDNSLPEENVVYPDENS